MNLTTFTSRAAAALVAAVAGFSSYRHIYEVAVRAGEHQAVALALPLSIDGLIVIGTMAMIEDKRAGRIPRQSARFALGFGIVATLAANIASAEPTWTARMVAAVPAISFLIAVEVLARVGKIKTGTTVTAARSSLDKNLCGDDLAEPANAEVSRIHDVNPDNVNTDPREAARQLYRRSVAEGVPLSGAELGRRFGKSERWGRDQIAACRQIVPLNGKINGKVAGGAA